MKPATLAILFLLLFSQAAYAYLDPGTGSYILQLIIAAFVGVSFAAKVYWKKITNFLSSRLSKQNKDEKDNI
jgi:energy-coupling factor transporter transmembrane protein EcfT